MCFMEGQGVDGHVGYDFFGRRRRRVMCFMEGQGVDGHVGYEFLCFLCLSSSTMV